MRADQLLVLRGLAPSRTSAQRMIAAGRLRANGAVVARPSENLAEHATLELAPGDEQRFVSRGGLKLDGALQSTGIVVRDRVCLDVGQSTGGFTDCLLQAGAARVVGVDVGHGQLHARLRDDPRIVAIEGINARALDAGTLGEAMPVGGFDRIVIDVSFISLTLVLPALAALAAPDAQLVALVKPQFEVGRSGLDGRGLVKSAALYDGVRAKITGGATDCGWEPLAWLDSPITGGDGNREFFLHAQRSSRMDGNDQGTH